MGTGYLPSVQPRIAGPNDRSALRKGRVPEAHRRDVPKAQVHIVYAEHFALDTAADKIADLVLRFMSNKQ